MAAGEDPARPNGVNGGAPQSPFPENTYRATMQMPQGLSSRTWVQQRV
jgi:hypothetical protein